MRCEDRRGVSCDICKNNEDCVIYEDFKHMMNKCTMASTCKDFEFKENDK